jgi:predicted nucleic-acid-binding protein
MRGSLDTSVLVQLVTGQTPHLADEATRLVEQAKGQLAIADAAMIELIFVLEKVKGLSRQHIVTTVDILAAQKALNFNRTLFVKALLVYVMHPALSIHDCCLVVYAGLNKAEPLWTFDKKLARQTAGAELVASTK